MDKWNVDNNIDVKNNFNLNVEVNIYHFNYTVVKISSSFKHLNIKNDFINNLGSYFFVSRVFDNTWSKLNIIGNSWRYSTKNLNSKDF